MPPATASKRKAAGRGRSKGVRREGKPTRSTRVVTSPPPSEDASHDAGSSDGVRHSSRVAHQGGRPDYSALARGDTAVAAGAQEESTSQGSASASATKHGGKRAKAGRKQRARSEQQAQKVRYSAGA